MKSHRTSVLILGISMLLMAILACSFPTATPEVESSDQEATNDAATQTATAQRPLASTTTPTSTQPQPQDTPTSISSPTLPPSATITATPPPDGVSLNCDGTYQRVRIIDNGAAGKTIAVDDWNGSSWINVWNLSSGDPMTRQLTAQAGYYEFLGCQKLVIVPFLYTGPHLWLEFSIHVWNGSSLTQVYFNEGYYAEWTKIGDIIRFREASELGGSPLGPCVWQTLEHEWDGSAFTQVGSVIDPVPGCTP